MNIRKHARAYLTALVIVATAAILWLLIAMTSSRTIQTSGSLSSGIEGSVFLAGDCKDKTPCPARRMKADVAVTDAHGKSLKMTTDANGKFTMKLAPGTYTASASNTAGKASPAAPSQQVTVTKDEFTRITFNFE